MTCLPGFQGGHVWWRCACLPTKGFSFPSNRIRSTKGCAGHWCLCCNFVQRVRDCQIVELLMSYFAFSRSSTLNCWFSLILCLLFLAGDFVKICRSWGTWLKDVSIGCNPVMSCVSWVSWGMHFTLLHCFVSLNRPPWQRLDEIVSCSGNDGQRRANFCFWQGRPALEDNDDPNEAETCHLRGGLREGACWPERTRVVTIPCSGLCGLMSSCI